jgi:plasmid maintenance system antidote protein VapI
MGTFKPQKIYPPGYSIKSILQQKEIATGDFASWLHSSEAEIQDLLEGRLALGPETAALLEKHLGVPATFWLKSEQGYRAYLVQNNEQAPSFPDKEKVFK